MVKRQVAYPGVGEDEKGSAGAGGRFQAQQGPGSIFLIAGAGGVSAGCDGRCMDRCTSQHAHFTGWTYECTRQQTCACGSKPLETASSARSHARIHVPACTVLFRLRRPLIGSAAIRVMGILKVRTAACASSDQGSRHCRLEPVHWALLR